jgi:L-asparaginase
MSHKKSILLIYTGGTIGMIKSSDGSLIPFDFDQLNNQIPELKKFDLQIDNISIENPIDSSNMHPDVWLEIAQNIRKNYTNYDGFVVLHGSDTMAYTASALSYLLESLEKPVILTGSQLPIGIARTDAKENLITSIEIAAEGKTPEVCIYFEYKLLRGNRATKVNASHFEAFESPNFPILAEAGVDISYNSNNFSPKKEMELKVHENLNTDIVVLKLFPGINKKTIQDIFNQDVKAIILETFGTGNAPSSTWFTELIKQALDEDKIILNITQCMVGKVTQGYYETSSELQKLGVTSGLDMTLESAITKSMFLLGQNLGTTEIKALLQISLRGELSN